MTVADIYIKDASVVPNAVVDAIVSLLDPTTSVPVAQVVTDANGKAGFLVPNGIYEVRVFKRGYQTPVASVLIDSSQPTNIFDLTVENLTALPNAVDSRLCRCTGRFVDFSNRPRKGVTFRVMAQAEAGFQVPKVVDGSMVFEDSMAFQTDENGKVSIDLFRGGEYYVTFAGEDDVAWNIKVPDRASMNLIELIHPAPASLTWDALAAPGGAVTVQVGEQIIVPVSMTFTDFQTISEGLDKWIIFTNSDGEIAEVSFATNLGAMAIRGLTSGSAQVTVDLRSGILPSRTPLPSLTVTPLSITVVP